MKNVILAPNPYRDKNFQTVREAQRILKNAGVQAKVCLPFEIDRSYELPRDIRFCRLDRELPNAEMVVCFGGDGMIISTPTGSTAYNLSAGGPVVEPDARNILLTPICAHDINSRCIVVSDKRTVAVQMTQNARRNCFLSVDGGKAIRVNMGNTVIIKKSHLETKLVRLNERNF